MRGSSPGRCRRPCRRPRSAPRRRGRRAPRRRPAAARRELDRVADEVAHDLADPLRVVADPERPVGQRRRSARIALALGGRPAAARRPTRRRRAGRRAAGRAGRARSRASRARAGSGRASRAGRAGAADESRNSARAAGSRPAGPWSSSLNVRSAAIGVRSSWETSARKSRLRSRSRRMIVDALLEPVGHRVELLRRARAARACPTTARRPATRAVRSPSASARDASVRRRSGVVKRWARNAATITATRNATAAMTSSRPVTLASVLRRNVYGFDSVTPMPQSCRRSPGRLRGARGRSRVARLAAVRRDRPRRREREPGAGTTTSDAVRVGRGRAEVTSTSAWATTFAASRAAAGSSSSGLDVRVELDRRRRLLEDDRASVRERPSMNARGSTPSLRRGR